MTQPPCAATHLPTPFWRAAGLALALLAAALPAQAQSFCASDGLPAPTALLERFISADCADCWADTATAKAARGTLALDWVLPGTQGDDAPLSAVAMPEAQDRLQRTGGALDAGHTERTTKVTRVPGVTLRVAHGLPVSDYIGTSIEARPASALRSRGSLTAWLALVETIPAGAENTPVERNLVRNVLESPWNGLRVLSKGERLRFFESRPMRVPDGAQRARLRVVGWVQDARGRVLAAAQSRCVPTRVD